MASATLTSKGQITIPKSVRTRLELEAGDRLEFQLREDGVIEVWPQDLDLLGLQGIIKPKVRGVTVEQMKRDIAASASRSKL